MDALRLFARVAARQLLPAGGLACPSPRRSAVLGASSVKSARRCSSAPPTRSSSPTSNADFLAQIEPILADLDEAQHAARAPASCGGCCESASGRALAVQLVYSAPPTLFRWLRGCCRSKCGINHVVPRTWRRRGRGRGAPLQDAGGLGATLIRSSRPWPRALVAAPDYLATAPPLTGPADLAAEAVASWARKALATGRSARPGRRPRSTSKAA